VPIESYGRCAVYTPGIIFVHQTPASAPAVSKTGRNPIPYQVHKAAGPRARARAFDTVKNDELLEVTAMTLLGADGSKQRR
jgi:hypothetical protein